MPVNLCLDMPLIILIKKAAIFFFTDSHRQTKCEITRDDRLKKVFIFLELCVPTR